MSVNKRQKRARAHAGQPSILLPQVISCQAIPLYMPCPARVLSNRYLSLTHSHSLGLAGLGLARARHGRHYAEKLSLDRAAILEPTATICAPIPPRKGSLRLAPLLINYCIGTEGKFQTSNGSGLDGAAWACPDSYQSSLPGKSQQTSSKGD